MRHPSWQRATGAYGSARRMGSIDGKRDAATIYRRRNDPGLPDDSIQSLFEDERGRIWVSGSRGLAAFENGKFTAVPAVPGGFTHAIASDNRGGLWLSLWLTSNDYGLAHLVDGKIIEHAPWQKLGGGPGTGLVPDPDGGVWTGLLSGGVANFRAGQIRNLSLTGDGASTIRKVLRRFARPRRHDVGRDRQWPQPDHERASCNAHHGERIALPNGSLDHRRPIGCPTGCTRRAVSCVSREPSWTPGPRTRSESSGRRHSIARMEFGWFRSSDPPGQRSRSRRTEKSGL